MVFWKAWKRQKNVFSLVCSQFASKLTLFLCTFHASPATPRYWPPKTFEHMSEKHIEKQKFKKISLLYPWKEIYNSRPKEISCRNFLASGIISMKWFSSVSSQWSVQARCDCLELGLEACMFRDSIKFEALQILLGFDHKKQSTHVCCKICVFNLFHDLIEDRRDTGIYS